MVLQHPGLIELQLLSALSAQLAAYSAGQLPAQAPPAQAQHDSPSTDCPAAATRSLNASTTHAHAGHAGHSPSTNSSPAAPTDNAHASTARAGDIPSTSSCPAGLAPARMVEICCGILANLYSCPALVPQLLAYADLTEAAAALMLELTDPPALSELCRLLTAALSVTPQVCFEHSAVCHQSLGCSTSHDLLLRDLVVAPRVPPALFLF